MSRASFNTTADFFFGAGTSTPGVLRFTVNCRYVVEDAIDLAGSGAPIRVAYLTHDGGPATPSWTPPAFGADARLADQVAIPSGSAATWWVLFEEAVLWQLQPIYWRSHLVALPLPAPASPVPVAGGGTDATATQLAIDVVYTIDLLAGVDQWFYIDFNGPDGYAVNVSGLVGAATLSTFEGPAGILSPEIPASTNGTYLEDPSLAIDGKKYIQLTADPSVDSTVNLVAIGTSGPPIPPPTPNTCATPEHVSAGVPLVASVSGGTTYWTDVPPGVSGCFTHFDSESTAGLTLQIITWFGTCMSLTMNTQNTIGLGGTSPLGVFPGTTRITYDVLGGSPTDTIGFTTTVM